MTCRKCDEKDAKKPQIIEKPINALSVICACGLTRLLPAGLKVGDKVELVPCPRCHMPFIGTFIGSKVELDEYLN